MANSIAGAKIPEEIIYDIFTRLPAKSIGQFRCVSKHWCSLLSDPKFIKIHLTLHSHKHLVDKLIIASHFLHTMTFTHDAQGEIDVTSRKLDIQQLSGHWLSVKGSCNGLVLAIRRGDAKYLLNPTTLKYHKIPNFDLALPVSDSCSMYGFGYDVVNDDYKVVALSYYNIDEPDIDDTFVDIYSLRKGLWKRLGSSPYDHSHYDHSHADPASGVFVNGALHWLVKASSPCVLVAFDLSDETFSEVPLPPSDYNYSVFELVALRGRLCMFTSLSKDTLTIFLMEDYAWTMVWLTVPSFHDSLCTPLCSMTDDDFVMEVDEKLVVYNMKEDDLWDLGFDVHPEMHTAGNFIESLVCPSFGNGTEG